MEGLMTHTITWALFFFLIGSALHTLAQVDAIARSKINGSRLSIFGSRWQTILIRTAWSLAFFTLWLQGQLVAVLTAAKIPLPDMLTGVLDLHVSGAVAFMGGYLFDSALAFIPGLKNTVPPPIDGPFGSTTIGEASANSTSQKVDGAPPKR
jgi:hypothetical protein